MKTLIINGSPRPHGNTAALISILKETLQGEIIEISAYRSQIAPCVDCRSCWKTAKCAVQDDMSVIYGDDFDNVVIASPVYFCTLPGQMLNILSRMQPWHVATYFLKNPLPQRRKKAAVILTAGGKGNASGANHHLRAFLRMLNAHGWEDRLVVSPNTDTLPAWEDAQAVEGVRAIAAWLNDPVQA